MAYATQQDLIDWCGINGGEELTQLTDPLNRYIDTLVVQAKLTQADAEINARLSGAVSLPLTAPYPKLVVNMACKIARHYLYTSGRPEHVADDYKGVLELLDAIRAGKASLGLDGAGTEPAMPEGADAPAYSAPDRTFSMDTLADF